MRKVLLAVITVMIMASCIHASELPAPVKSGSVSLMEALTLRRSTREFADVDLTAQDLSNLLYATAGVNRPDGKRVHPAALGLQDTSIYVFNREGVYKYDAPTHSLELIAEGDHRQATGKQDFVGMAAVNLAYVHDSSLWKGVGTPREVAEKWGYAHTGAVMQNAYLFAASMGWNAVVRGSFNAEELSKLMKLTDTQKITLIHSIGPRP